MTTSEAEIFPAFGDFLMRQMSRHLAESMPRIALYKVPNPASLKSHHMSQTYRLLV